MATAVLPFFNDSLAIEERLRSLEQFLLPWISVWQPSALASYPDPLRDIPQHWVDYLEMASESDLFFLSNFKCTGTGLPNGLPHDLRELAFELRSLCEFPFYFHDQSLLLTDPIYKQQINGLQLKKSHELRNLGPLVKDFSDVLKVSTLVEVGGGKGFLSLAASGCEASHIVIDQSQDLLNKCQSYFTRWSRHKKIECIACYIADMWFQSSCGIDQDSLLVGLHLCGNLTNDYLKSVILNRNRGVVSLGCCYHRLEVSQQNISGQCRLSFGDSEFRLALAPYHYKSIETYRNNVIKNIYRFALFDLTKEITGTTPIVSSLNHYEYPHRASVLDFSLFLDENSEQASLLASKATLMDLYDRKSRKAALDMEKFEYIRRMFSRALEVYLVLDRALFLQQNGMETVVLQVFDGRISPRNLGIIARF